MALPTNDIDWINRLARQHDFQKKDLRILNDEYELKSRRSYMHPEILRELGERLQQVVVAWPMLVVDSLEERLDVEGFRLPSDDEADDDLWRVWQENSADEQSQQAHIDALVMRRSYIAIGTNEDDDDTPLMTFESPLEVWAETDPRTRKVRAALRRYRDEDSVARNGTNYATLYLPAATSYYQQGKSGWTLIDRDEHELGEVPVVPLINRSRLSDQAGRSELSPILPLARAVNKISTDMMVAAEFVALPLRGFMGIGPDALQDAEGNSLTAVEAIMGKLLMIPEGETGTVKQFEFASAQLTNFTTVVDKLAQLVASIAGLPPHYMGMSTDNPPSADAIRSNEARLVKRAERRQRAFGGSHEQAMRLVRRFQTGEWDPKLKRLETIWRDASTPTVAQKADAAVKLRSVGISTLQQAREDVGYTDAQIRRMKAEDAAETDTRLSLFKLPTAAEQHASGVTVPAPGPAPEPEPVSVGAAA